MRRSALWSIALLVLLFSVLSVAPTLAHAAVTHAAHQVRPLPEEPIDPRCGISSGSIWRGGAQRIWGSATGFCEPETDTQVNYVDMELTLLVCVPNGSGHCDTVPYNYYIDYTNPDYKFECTSGIGPFGIAQTVTTQCTPNDGQGHNLPMSNTCVTGNRYAMRVETWGEMDDGDGPSNTPATDVQAYTGKLIC